MLQKISLFWSYFDGLDNLAPDDQLTVYRAIIRYAFLQEVPELTGTPAYIFGLIKPNLDVSISYANGGAIGGKAKSKPTASLDEAQPKPDIIPDEAEDKPTASPDEQDIGYRNKDKGIRNKDIGVGSKDIGEGMCEKAGKPAKHKHGEYQHVLLTEDEYQRLSDELGEEMLAKCIRKLDEYIEEKGYKAKSHYLSIKRWVVDAVREHRKKDGGIDWDSV